MDMSQYRDLFVSESKGHIQAFNQLILQLEEGSGGQAAIDELFRHAHSLKGMAATMQFTPIAELAHQAEDQLSRVRAGEMTMTHHLADLLLEANDTLAVMVSAVEAGADPPAEHQSLLNRLNAYSPEDRQTAAEPPLPATETAPPVTAAPHLFRQSDTLRSVRIRTEVLDRLVDITGELINVRHHLADHARNLPEPAMVEAVDRMSKLVRELRDEVFMARMLPFSMIAERFPRLVRDLARRQGKEVTFQLVGRDIELDRSILEEIAEPLVHALRNAVDHGIETPEERRAAGKPESGTVTLHVTRDRDRVELCISDDGRGMSPERILATAIERGVVTPEQATQLTTPEVLMLVCTPGFSTAAAVSDISGRGVGMDAVREAAQLLGGTLSLSSEPGHGSRITLRLPITVSIIHSLMVACGRLTVAFPLSTVVRTCEIVPHNLTGDSHDQFCLTDDGCRLPVRQLSDLLGQPRSHKPGTPLPAVMTESGTRPALLAVDRLIGQREMFIKPLAPPLSRLHGITGGAIAGDGQIIFVLDAGAFV